jgi:hypothetical protein
MGSIRITTTLLGRGPAAAIVLDDEQVAAVHRPGSAAQVATRDSRFVNREHIRAATQRQRAQARY